MLNLILVGVFLTTFFLIIGIYNTFFFLRINMLTRLKEIEADEIEDMENSKIEKKISSENLFQLFGICGRFLPQSKYLGKIKKNLIQASVLMKPEEFIGISLIGAIFLGGLIYIIFKSIFLGLIFIPFGFIIPHLILKRKKAKRMAKINSQLPEALDIISNGLRAGFSFIQAISVVTNEINGPLKEEFNKLLRDNVLGKSIEEAIISMSDRTDNEDLDMVLTALIIQRQVGGNLAEVLDTISETIRERVKIKADIKTLSAQGKISGIIVSLLPFALGMGLYIINQSYLSILFTTFIGKIMVAVGIVLQLIGIFVLMKLADIKV